MTDRAWRRLASRPLIERPWLTVHEQRLALPSGVEIAEFHLLEAPDWVAVIAVEGGHVVTVEQWRPGANSLSLELPAGVIDEGESPLDAARRELLEETGYEADEWVPLSVVHTEPSRHTNRAHFYVARGARRVADPSPESTEQIALRRMAVGELLRAVEDGQILHGVHVGAILLAERRGLLG